MINVNKRVKKVVSNIKRSNCTNNTQRVFLDLLRARTKSGWVARTAINVPSVGARIRDLRKEEFGSFDVECATASELNRSTTTDDTARQTFYRVNPKSVTVDSVKTVFRDVV